MIMSTQLVRVRGLHTSGKPVQVLSSCTAVNRADHFSEDGDGEPGRLAHPC